MDEPLEGFGREVTTLLQFLSPAKRKGERMELGSGGRVEISRSICGAAKNNNCSVFVFGHFRANVALPAVIASYSSSPMVFFTRSHGSGRGPVIFYHFDKSLKV